MKKTILLFAAAVLLSMASIFAQGGTTGPLTWEINDGTLTISGEGEMPNYLGTSSPWNDYKDDIHTLIVESGVTSIGSLAFGDLKNLTSVSISNTVLSIRNLAFYSCTKLPAITIPNGVLSIGSRAFDFCLNLSSATLPKSVIDIKLSAFVYCVSLTSIEVASANKNYASENGILFNKDKSVLLFYPEGKSGAYIIPKMVVTIRDSAFFYCEKLTAITIPNSVTSIGSRAFKSCTDLTSINIPNSLTSIETETFCECSSLTAVNIPNSIKSIGEFAFSGCSSLTSIIIPKSVTIIGMAAFQSCRGLKLITNLNPVPVNIDWSVFAWIDQGTCTLEVPVSSVSAYKEANVWKEFNIVGVNVGIETIVNAAFKIFPNPTMGELRIMNYKLRITDVEIFDVFGRKQKTERRRQKAESEIVMDILSLPTGVYFVKIYTEKGMVVEKVIKN